MKVTRINHAAINVHGKWPEVEEFYTEFMGIGTTPRPGSIDGAIGGCWLQLPNGQVHVIDAEMDGSAGNPVGPHISYYVEDFAGRRSEVVSEELDETLAGVCHGPKIDGGVGQGSLVSRAGVSTGLTDASFRRASWISGSPGLATGRVSSRPQPPGTGEKRSAQ